jgi:hypothetical protein
MGKETRIAAIGLLISAAACGSGSGGGSSSGGTSGSGNTVGSVFHAVNLINHSPANNALQVPLNATIRLEFDTDMSLDSFRDEDTWLRRADSDTNVPVTFSRSSNGWIDCQPDSDLQAETDYVFQLSPLTSDLSGRILDVTSSFAFRSFDQRPPSITGFDVANGSTSVSRTRSFTLSLDEAVDPDSISGTTLYLRDVFDTRYECECTTIGQTIVIDPHTDLPGDRQFFIVATTALCDSVGNELEEQFQTSFYTQTDSQQPSVVDTWPQFNATDMSPHLQPTFTFSESMDPSTVEAVSLLFQDEYGSIIPFAIDATLDQRTLRVRPMAQLHENRRYTLEFLLGAAATTDVSGNGLIATQELTFTTGSDNVSPTLIESSPTHGESQVPGVLVAEFTFDEDIDALRVNETTAKLLVAGKPWASVIELADDNTVRVTPIMTLPVDTLCTLTLVGGQSGLRDLAGNAFAADKSISFTTSNDSELPEAMIMPPNGSVAIATSSHVSIVFDAPMDPATLTTSTILITDDYGTPINGSHTVSANNRVVIFEPDNNLPPYAYYRVLIRSGNHGARRLTGNWFDRDQLSRFRTGQAIDTTTPTITATVNGIPSSRREGMVLPPAGFTIDITTSDEFSQWVDMGSIKVDLTGGTGPTSESLLATATIGVDSVQIQVTESSPLSTGTWTLTASAADLSGNSTQSEAISFEVNNPDSGSMPFERTQLVWVRTDLDRDDNGTEDFIDDMVRLGFNTDGDPIGTNAYMQKVLLDGILAKANHIYHRGSRGEPLDNGTVQLRFLTREPSLLPHMQIALGGLDPEGDRTRTYGSESTGVLGRAYYDYRNSNPTERNTGSSPGLGVFPAEMWLYQSYIHAQAYPSFQTQFASKFLAICPNMGGTPAGSNPYDAAVLNASFDYDSATPSQRARWNAIMSAADDWAAVIGVILAHEVGHSVGLVAPGAMPNGLFGDSSLHDTYANAAEVMAPSVGYNSMTSLDYEFRDIDLAYLRMRILLR